MTFYINIYSTNVTIRTNQLYKNFFRLTLLIRGYYNVINLQNRIRGEVFGLEIVIPDSVSEILSRFKSSGFEAFAVGGCVRDSIMGISPKDWDVTTNALPDDTKNLFSDYKVIETGIKHGTITVIVSGMPVEITTYRLDGAYSDNRRPDSVTFTNELLLDLSRRDFTINAMAYNPEKHLVDEFGSLFDLNNKLIRTVGNPDIRFSEDGLRIMRALRFASVLDFDIEKNTSDSIHKNKELLKNIAVERLFSELNKLLLGKRAGRILLEYGEVLGTFIPEILPTIGQHQHGDKHCYDVWEHICRAVDNIEPKKELRLTMLMHDLGKAATAGIDENGNSTFKNHAEISAEIAAKILSQLKSDKKTASLVTKLISLHDFEIPESEIEVKRLLKNVTPEELRLLLKIKKADRAALSPAFRDVSEKIANSEKYLDEILSENKCYKQEHLAINGNDIAKKGYEGAEIGKKLDELLNAVIDGKCGNTRKELLAFLEKNQQS